MWWAIVNVMKHNVTGHKYAKQDMRVTTKNRNVDTA